MFALAPHGEGVKTRCAIFKWFYSSLFILVKMLLLLVNHPLALSLRLTRMPVGARGGTRGYRSSGYPPGRRDKSRGTCWSGGVKRLGGRDEDDGGEGDKTATDKGGRMGRSDVITGVIGACETRP